MDSFDLGRHEAQINALSERMGRMEQTTDRIDKNVMKLMLAKAEVVGGWKVAAVVSGGVGGAMGLLATLLFKWSGH